MVYDLTFFVWCGILLFNIIAGLMLDAFGQLREDAGNREECYSDTCFVCGFDRKDYDNLNLGSEYPTFDQHKMEDHNRWNFIYFIDYIQTKDATEYTGAEQYVADQIAANEMLWVPVRSSFAVATSDSFKKLEDDEAQALKEEQEKHDVGKKKKRKKVRGKGKAGM